jgi:glycosyltransferase involved in cell wall biosynthesis
LPTIENGVALPPSRAQAKRRFCLMLGRVCPEKGFHLGIDAALLAGVPLVMAGQVFDFEAHRNYFDRDIRPRLGPSVRFIGPLDLSRKRRFLRAAHCLLVPSLASETSSLVAMEALSCGTPVIAYRAGALPEIVEHGRTGFIVNDVDAMAAAIRDVGSIDPETCRDAARRRFSAERMVERYLAMYHEVAQGAATIRDYATSALAASA